MAAAPLPMASREAATVAGDTARVSPAAAGIGGPDAKAAAASGDGPGKGLEDMAQSAIEKMFANSQKILKEAEFAKAEAEAVAANAAARLVREGAEQ